jgi:cytochrome c556
MSLKTRALGALTCLSILLSSAGLSTAIAISPVRDNARQAKQELKDGEMAEARADVRCTALTAQINAKLKLLQSHRDRHIKHYVKLHERLTMLMAKLDEKGYDTSLVKADLVALQQKIDQSKLDFEDVITKLEATKSLDCADAEGEFKAALQESREALEKFRLGIKDMHDFVKNTLRPHLTALRDQKPEASPSASPAPSVSPSPSTNP